MENLINKKLPNFDYSINKQQKIGYQMRRDRTRFNNKIQLIIKLVSFVVLSEQLKIVPTLARINHNENQDVNLVTSSFQLPTNTNQLLAPGGSSFIHLPASLPLIPISTSQRRGDPNELVASRLAEPQAKFDIQAPTSLAISNDINNKLDSTSDLLGSNKLSSIGKILLSDLHLSALNITQASSSPLTIPTMTTTTTSTSTSTTTTPRPLSNLNNKVNQLKSSKKSQASFIEPSKQVAQIEQKIINQHAGAHRSSAGSISSSFQSSYIPNKQRDSRIWSTILGARYNPISLASETSLSSGAPKDHQWQSLIQLLRSGFMKRSSIVKALGDNKLSRSK